MTRLSHEEILFVINNAKFIPTEMLIVILDYAESRYRSNVILHFLI